MARRFGPTLGAGVVVIETPPDKTITPAPTGVTCYIGQVERGDTDELISCPTRADFVRKCGGYLAGSNVPDSVFDFWNLGNGSGEMFIVRVTDGTEVASSMTVYARRTGHGAYAGPKTDPAYDESPQALFTLQARNGGRWGGRMRTLTFDYDEASNLTNTTLTTGTTMLENEFAGARLTIDSAPGKSYTVLSNTTAGVLTVSSDARMYADSGEPAAANTVEGNLYLDNKDITFPASAIGTRKGLSVVFKDAQENDATLFGMEVYLDDNLVLEYLNLSMDSESKYYIDRVINQDDNAYIKVTVSYSGSITSKQRPGNSFGAAADWSANVLTTEFYKQISTDFASDNAAWVADWEKPAGARLRKGKYKATYVAADAKWTITSVAGNGHEFDLGTAFQSAAKVSGKWAVTSPTIFFPSFNIYEGLAGVADGDEIQFLIDPLPIDKDGNGTLKGHWLYYNPDADSRARIRISDNTQDTITLASTPSASPPSDPTAPSATLSSGTLAFPLAVAGNFEMEHSKYGKIEFDMSHAGYADIGAFVSSFNTNYKAATGSATDIGSVDGSTMTLTFDTDLDDTSKGLNAFIRINGKAGAMTQMGFPNPIISAGTAGTSFRLQAPTELEDGHNGGEPSQAQYLAAANTDTSLINRIFGRNKGLVKLALPGISEHGSSTQIQKGFISYAEAKNYQYRIEMPKGTTDDTAAVEYINDTIGRNDFAVVSYPSWGFVPNPEGEGLVERSLIGSIHGREALVAYNFNGYHKAAAGLDVTLPNVAKLATGEAVLNEEVLNPQGINVIKKAKGNFILWGDRTVSLDSGWKWKHQRELMSYYENIMREEFDFIIFAINDATTQQQLIVTLQAFFIPEWQKRALRGNKFKEACSIKIDDENNTNLTRAAGDLNAEIKLRLADTVERFIIRIGKAGIFEDLG